MENSTKTALVVAASGYALNRYMKSRQGDRPTLTLEESRLQMLGGGVTVLGLASAGILEYTKDKPKARNTAFIGLGALTIGYFAVILYALKKMS